MKSEPSASGGVNLSGSSRESPKKQDARRSRSPTASAISVLVKTETKKLFSFSLPPEACRQLDQVTEAFLMTQQERGFRTLDYYKQLRGQSFS